MIPAIYKKFKHKNKSFNWQTTQARKIYMELKDTELFRDLLSELIKNICLSYSKYEFPFQMHTYGSDYGMGGVLL